MLNQQFGLKFEEFFSLAGLIKLDQSFLSYLSQQDFNLYAKYVQYRAKPGDYTELEISNLLIETAYYLEDFLVLLFDLESEYASLRKSSLKFDAVYECKRKFIQRYALNKYSASELQNIDFESLQQKLQKIIGDINQDNIVQYYFKWNKETQRYQAQLDLLAQYCAYGVYHNFDGILFKTPRPIKDNLINADHIKLLQKQLYTGFNYRDHTLDSNIPGMNHAKYCLYCHHRQKDTCRTGFKDKVLEKNGCPLKQKISEMSLLYSKGSIIGSLSIIMIDNPLLAATGYRICNDCAKTCIYQKQEPVDIPVIESTILNQTINLPWGVEIYWLLTRWNPLNLSYPLPKIDSGYNIVVAGLGPAGFALSHYLLKMGHNVLAIDGIKISPLHFDPMQPIKFWHDIKIPLAEKLPQGFGGVAEYGITNRWDKNNLTLIRLILERSNNFTMVGGTRLGSNINLDQAFKYGFHHVALCLGAGAPKYLNNAQFFARNIRPAVDFLMNLQQGGAFLQGNNIGLLVQLPAVVIGCGLTAIDAAVELLHYYLMQIEKIATDYHQGKIILDQLTIEGKELVQNCLSHQQQIANCKTDQEKLQLIQQITGGVSICYRKNLQDSPAYKLNHEEVEHAMAAGVTFYENFAVKDIITDKYNNIKQITSQDGRKIGAKLALMAIGIEDNSFVDIKTEIAPEGNIFINKDKNISFLGDCNPNYSGSVVKAIASAKDAHLEIDREVRKYKPKKLTLELGKFNNLITDINRISHEILELKISAPFAVQNFVPGQFFKLQNYSTDPSSMLKPMAITPIKVDKKQGIMTFLIFNELNISKILERFNVNDEVSLMGPTGAPMANIRGKRVLLIGEGFNNLLLMPIAEQLRKNKCETTLLAHYQQDSKLYYQQELEQSVDRIIWSSESKITPRKEDIYSDKPIISTLLAAKKARFIGYFDKIICYLPSALRQELIDKRVSLFGHNSKILFAAYAPMQCMMKGICGKCILPTQNGEYIFACKQQFIEV